MQQLDGSTTLPSGLRLRLRIPHRSDAVRLRDLFDRLDVQADELALSRLVRFDPRQRVSVVASVLLAGSEELVGIAVAEHGAAEPEFLVADEIQAPGAGKVLVESLRSPGLRASRIA